MDVRRRARGHGLGAGLLDRAVATAAVHGFGRLRLETLPDATGSAVSLYRAAGFVERPAFDLTSVPGVVAMELRVGAAERRAAASTAERRPPRRSVDARRPT